MFDFIDKNRIKSTSDGFFATDISISDILMQKNIFSLIDKDGSEIKCSFFYDDWYLFGIENKSSVVYGLFKMREQEFDKDEGADGDIPGVTVSFIEFSIEKLISCISQPSDENKIALSEEIDKVAAKRGQKHSLQIKEYFIKTECKAPYLIAEMYIEFIAGFFKNGFIDVPVTYKLKKQKKRISDFLNENNRKAGYVVFDEEKIYIKNPANLTDYEKYAILATHTGNTSFNSFAAEVQYHAKFLNDFMKIKIPVFGRSVYDSAIRADMSVCDNEFEGPAPFYKADSKIIKMQIKIHGIK